MSRRVPSSAPSNSKGKEPAESNKNEKKPIKESIIKDIDSDDEKANEAINDIIRNPKKVSESLRELNIDSKVMQNIISDVKSNKEAISEAEKMAKDSNLRTQLLKTMSGSASSSRAERPKIKEMRKIKKNMKNAIRDSGDNGAEKASYQAVVITQSRNVKKIKIDCETPMESASKYFKSPEISICDDLEKYITGAQVLYNPSLGGKNRRIERLIGKNYGFEIIIWCKNGDFSEEDLIKIEKDISVAADTAES